MMNDIGVIIEEDVENIISSLKTKEFENKSILITGASGLLGTYFVACFDKIAKSRHAPKRIVATIYSELPVHLTQIARAGRVEFCRGDLTSDEFLAQLDKFDFIIHAAGYGQPGKFMEDKLKTIKLNTSTTMSLFSHLNQNGHFLFLSSSEVYSGSTKSPYSEDGIGVTNTTHPRACYIEAKRCGETICNVQRDNGIAASSARLALAYGPGTRRDDKRVINSFIQRALTESQIMLQDMGAAYRTYCYITDAIELLFNILMKGKAPIYNVGGKSRTTIKNLANCIAEYVAVPVLLPDAAESIIGSPDDVQLDMSLAAKEFNKNHYVGLDVGVARTIEWQKALYNQTLIGN